jgi:hypothetical protein
VNVPPDGSDSWDSPEPPRKVDEQGRAVGRRWVFEDFLNGRTLPLFDGWVWVAFDGVLISPICKDRRVVVLVPAEDIEPVRKGWSFARLRPSHGEAGG